MPTLKEITDDIQVTETIENISNIYHEIANLRMKKIREKVLENRYFFEELLGVYKRAKSAINLAKNKNKYKNKEKRERKKKKEVMIVLSANHPFYGTLILNIWKNAHYYYQKNNPDLVITGRTGKHLAESIGLGHKIFYFELNDDYPEKKNINAILEFVKDYRKIVVFYGKYKTALSQVSVMSEISEIPFKGEKQKKRYIFEPSPRAIINFFEEEIIASLFSQCLLEHQLAKYSSRAISMYKARENAKEFKKNLEKNARSIKRQIENNQLIELFSKVNLT